MLTAILTTIAVLATIAAFVFRADALYHKRQADRKETYYRRYWDSFMREGEKMVALAKARVSRDAWKKSANEMQLQRDLARDDLEERTRDVEELERERDLLRVKLEAVQRFAAGECDDLVEQLAGALEDNGQAALLVRGLAGPPL